MFAQDWASGRLPICSFWFDLFVVLWFVDAQTQDDIHLSCVCARANVCACARFRLNFVGIGSFC